MEIPPPSNTNPAATLSPSRPSELLNQLQVGQVLVARVERLLAGGDAELRIGQNLLRVNSPINLATGQPLSLKVEASVEGPLLRIAQQASQVEALARAYRAAIPKQSPLANVVSQLQKIIATPAATIRPSTNAAASVATSTPNIPSPTLPKTIQTAIRELVRSLPEVSTLSKPEGLKTAIKDAGPLLETRLFNSAKTAQPINTQADVKANFLRAARSLLQFQASQTSVSSPTPTGVGAANTAQTSVAGRNGIEIYNALLQAATAKPNTESAKAESQRPLLPTLPLPLPLPVQSQPAPLQTEKILASLPAFLSKFLPGNLGSTEQASTQAKQAQAATNQILHRLTAELLNQIESGLARIQQQQLNLVPSDEPVRTLVNTEFPILNGQQYDNLSLQIESEETKNADGEKQHIWRATIRFELPDLGFVQAIVSIKEHRVFMEFRSEQQTTTVLFRSQIAVLEKKLRDAGLNLGESTFSTGKIAVRDTTVSGLLNTEA